MIDPAVPSAGDHGLPASFSSAPLLLAPQRPRRRRAIRTILTAVGGVVLLTGGFVALQLGASAGYDDAHAAERSAEQAQQTSVQQVEAALVPNESATHTVGSVLKTQDGGLMDGADRTALEAAQKRALGAGTSARGLIPRPAEETGVKPFWFWEANGSADRLRSRADKERSSATALKASAKQLEESTHALQSSVASVVTAAADRAATTEPANVPAKNDSVLALRTAVSQTKELSSPLQESLSAVYPALVLAVQRLQESHAATLAAEAGPLAGSRAELEAFARSLAPGVLIDFEWADLVNGKGSANDYLSGETAWRYDQGGFATIRLSNSIAEDWPSDAAHALVAHEVGHAITVRCRTMYNADDPQTAEAWATAWAISMGFTDDANGTWAYGAPPADLITTAAGCR